MTQNLTNWFDNVCIVCKDLKKIRKKRKYLQIELGITSPRIRGIVGVNKYRLNIFLPVYFVN